MSDQRRHKGSGFGLILFAGLLLLPLTTAQAQSTSPPSAKASVLVGTAYDTTHVYVSSKDIDVFVASILATFGGHATTRVVTNVLPVPSRTESQAILTPFGNLSVFAFETPIPFPFGQERNGYLVTDMDKAVKTAEAAGAEVIVAPFNDPIGRDAVVQWPGGVKMQFYWHTKPSKNAPLQTVPESRVYVSPDRADEFVRDIVRFAKGKIFLDDKKADGAEIDRPGSTFRRIHVKSALGETVVLVTDGHLPYPFGYETTGYSVDDLQSTLAKAKAAGAQVLAGPTAVGARSTAIVQFPGGYIAEIHSAKAP